MSPLRSRQTSLPLIVPHLCLCGLSGRHSVLEGAVYAKKNTKNKHLTVPLVPPGILLRDLKREAFHLGIRDTWTSILLL